jgi:rSAM/selenodomain-associated transferase 1
MESLVLFARSPRPGTVKTRIASARSDRDALALYTAFLLDTAEMCADWRRQTVAVDPNRRLILYVTPEGEDPLLAEVARRCGARIVVQPEGDLGHRLQHIFEAEFSRGARSVCAIGSDSPTLPRHLVDHAFRALTWERVVLGPTFDGGYWIAGAQRPAPDMFSGIPWSTETVLRETLALLEGQGISGHLLPFWYDVDEDEDLKRLAWHVQALRAEVEGSCPHTYNALVDAGLLPASEEGKAA